MWQNEQNSWAEQYYEEIWKKNLSTGRHELWKMKYLSRYSINILHMVTQVWQCQINDSVIISAMICVNKKKSLI